VAQQPVKNTTLSGLTRSLTRTVCQPPAGRKSPDLFHKKIHNVNFFVKKKKAYHAAAGESGFVPVNRPK
jgi:hypothetical protein